MATLNVTEGQIRTSLNTLSPQGICQDDKRGRRAPKNKVSGIREEYLRRHILSFPTVNKKNSMKKFVEGNLTVSEMHKMYVSRCNEANMKPVSLEKYRLIVKEYNIAFQKQKGGQPKAAKIPKLPMNQNCNPSVSEILAGLSTKELAEVNEQTQHEAEPQYNPDAMNVGIATNNENLAIASYLIGFETAKGYNEKPPVPTPNQRPQNMNFPVNNQPFYGNFNGYNFPNSNNYIAPNNTNANMPITNPMRKYSIHF